MDATTPHEAGASGLRLAFLGDDFTGSTDALEARMRGRVGEETLITVRRADAEGQPKSVDCLITPCAGMEESDPN